MWERKALSWTGSLKDDGSHRVGHTLDNYRDIDTLRDQESDGVVQRKPIGNVAAGTVDVQGDGFVAFVGKFPKSFDRLSGRILLDVADEVDVAEAIALLFADDSFDRVDEFTEQALIYLGHDYVVRMARADQAG
jgi:hypothetical protein